MTIVKKNEIPPGTARLVEVHGQEVALFHVDGKFYAIHNRCPHRGGPLVHGKVERISSEAGEVLAVRCPLHGWLFDLANGRCLIRPGTNVQTFPVMCQGDDIALGPSA
jgi:NAD(P)H-dependent nitrite reductase small subunit